MRNIDDSVLDGNTTLRDTAAVEMDGKTIVVYTRSVSDGVVPISFSSQMVVNYAVGSMDAIGPGAWHGAENRGHSTILLAESSEGSDEPLEPSLSPSPDEEPEMVDGPTGRCPESDLAGYSCVFMVRC